VTGVEGEDVTSKNDTTEVAKDTERTNNNGENDEKADDKNDDDDEDEDDDDKALKAKETTTKTTKTTKAAKNTKAARDNDNDVEMPSEVKSAGVSITGSKVRQFIWTGDINIDAFSEIWARTVLRRRLRARQYRSTCRGEVRSTDRDEEAAAEGAQDSCGTQAVRDAKHCVEETHRSRRIPFVGGQ
jgi:hypothetical protein